MNVVFATAIAMLGVLTAASGTGAEQLWIAQPGPVVTWGLLTAAFGAMQGALNPDQNAVRNRLQMHALTRIANALEHGTITTQDALRLETLTITNIDAVFDELTARSARDDTGGGLRDTDYR
jgi:hypothetical protein